MKRAALWILGLVATLSVAGSTGAADVSAGVRISDGEAKAFYLAVGEFFQVPEKQVVVVRERRIADDELAVVFYIAKRARVAPEGVVQLRLDGKTWLQIVRHYRLSPAIFYVPVNNEPGPPYGKAYGHFRKYRKSEWKKIELDDEDIVNLVNLRVISNHYGCSADDIIRLRSQGKTFAAINGQVRKAKEETAMRLASRPDKEAGPSDSEKKPGKNR